jgi:hypothetical protein
MNHLPRLLVVAVALAWPTGRAMADPGYYVTTPYYKEGLHNIDFRYWTTKSPGRPEMIWPEVGLGYGVNSRWTTELFVSWIGSSQRATRVSSINWQNSVLLTQGEHDVDVAVHAQLIVDRIDRGAKTLEIGPVLQTDIGRTQLNGNLILERSFDAAKPKPTQLKYQWQVRHRWRNGLHLGAQGFGELGAWDDWAPHSRQSHRAGPAVFATWRINDRQQIAAQAAMLLGRTYGRSGHMSTLRVNYEY